MTSTILVVGSTNTDMVIKAAKLPAKGETVIGGTFLMTAGGKGANQAVAAARLGGQVTFVTKVGDDVFGRQSVQGFEKEGIDTAFVYRDSENPSGVALIGVDAEGENSIMVASGANATLIPDEATRAIDAITDGQWLLLQLEIPMPTVEAAIVYAAARGWKVILNPAPAQTLPPTIFKYLFAITPNESETELLTGIKVTDLETARQAAQQLFGAGVPNVIVTLGAKGVLVCNATGCKHMAAPVVEAMDTTAAGDVFNGALVVALAEGQALDEALVFACQAAAISVTRMGAQASAPFRNEIVIH